MNERKCQRPFNERLFTISNRVGRCVLGEIVSLVAVQFSLRSSGIRHLVKVNRRHLKGRGKSSWEGSQVKSEDIREAGSQWHSKLFEGLVRGKLSQTEKQVGRVAVRTPRFIVKSVTCKTFILAFSSFASKVRLTKLLLGSPESESWGRSCHRR